jgi:hypothetical protein
VGEEVKKKKTPPKQRFQQIYDAFNMAWVDVWTLGKDCATPGDMPSQVTILGQKYRVRYRTKIYNHPRKSSQLLGVVVFDNRLIIIDPAQTLIKMKHVLLHEVCHAYMHEIRARDPRLQRITDAEEEGICDLFGEAVYDFASNNPIPK